MKTKAKQFIKSELAKKGVNYVQLSKLMREKGYQETPDTIRTKIHRGSFSFSFVLELCDTLNLELSLSTIGS